LSKNDASAKDVCRFDDCELVMRHWTLPLLLFLTACGQSPPDSHTTQNEPPRDAAQDGTVEVVLDESSWGYKRVSEAEADTVLVVAFNILRDDKPTEHRFPFKKNPKALNSDFAPITKGLMSDGISKDGHATGTIESISVLAGDNGTVLVDLSESKTDHGGTKTDIKETIQVPWNGRVEKTLPQGGRIVVHFEKPKRQDGRHNH
jgi:hypothetical protein